MALDSEAVLIERILRLIMRLEGGNDSGLRRDDGNSSICPKEL